MVFGILSQKLCINSLQQLKNKASLWSYVAIAFNRVDNNRLNLVGANRLCAEWVLKNGGAVSFTIAPEKFVGDYNALPPENVRLKIKGVDASNSSIMKIGLDHLKNCTDIDKIIFHKCKHLEETGLDGLTHVKDTLRHLEVSSCYNLVGSCLLVIKELSNLKYLKIADLQYVKNIDNVAAELKKSLPNCEMEISK